MIGGHGQFSILFRTKAQKQKKQQQKRLKRQSCVWSRKLNQSLPTLLAWLLGRLGILEKADRLPRSSRKKPESTLLTDEVATHSSLSNPRGRSEETLDDVSVATNNPIDVDTTKVGQVVRYQISRVRFRINILNNQP